MIEELGVLRIRLQVLQSEKNELFQHCLPQATKLKEVTVDCSTIYENKYDEYLIESEPIDKEIISIKNKIRIIEYELKKSVDIKI